MRRTLIARTHNAIRNFSSPYAQMINALICCARKICRKKKAPMSMLRASSWRLRPLNPLTCVCEKVLHRDGRMLAIN